MTLECTKCRLAWIPRHAGEATCPRCASQVDVTRLAAELAESARARAVSQGEAADMDADRRLILKGYEERGVQIDGLRGDLERARAKIEEVRAELQNHALLPVLQRQLRVFLAPPAPTASPEPDRASPEAPKETNEPRR